MPIFAILVLDELDISQNNCISGSKSSRQTTSKNDIIEECFYDLHGTDGRMLIGLKNKNVLRGTKKSFKNLVNLTELN